MSVVDIEKIEEKCDSHVIDDKIRNEAVLFAKDFKISWVHLGRHLYAIYQDKLFLTWGFDQFEDYALSELGLKKSLCLKLLKAYLFIEQDEPIYLEKTFIDNRKAIEVPHYDAVDILRLAKHNKDLLAQDYKDLKHKVFYKGEEASEVKKELTAMIKQRKPVNPEEERDKRHRQSLTKFIQSLKTFERDMETLHLISDDLMQEAHSLLEKLEDEINS